MRIEIKRIRRDELLCPRLKQESHGKRRICYAAKIIESGSVIVEDEKADTMVTDIYELALWQDADGRCDCFACRPRINVEHLPAAVETYGPRPQACCVHVDNISLNVCEPDLSGIDGADALFAAWMETLSVHLINFDGHNIDETSWDDPDGGEL